MEATVDPETLYTKQNCIGMSQGPSEAIFDKLLTDQ